ncbi:MAG: hypothetical protein M3Y07_07760, partial [Acidobacteriota bacterium]|nr:hypothetical protein [Acidobacteriota bacterium]
DGPGQGTGIAEISPSKPAQVPGVKPSDIPFAHRFFPDAFDALLAQAGIELPRINSKSRRQADQRCPEESNYK